MYEHLYEINDQWLRETSPVNYLELVSFANENERIQIHLELVEQLLRERSVSHLSVAQQAHRRMVLDHLQAYWKAGRFPVNNYVAHRIPVFVDQHNTACAVGHLLRQTGEDDLVRQITEENNFADLQELLAYEAVPTWAEANGFTVEELAWIQPGYSVVYFDALPFGNDLGIDGGQVLDMQVYDAELYLAGSFTAIDGHAATKITAWDGTGFRNFPGLSVSDQINKIAFDEATGDLYAIGVFAFADEEHPSVFARYRNNNWEPLLNITETEIVTTFHDLICEQGECYLVGDFTRIKNDTTIQYFASYDMATDQWSPFNENLQFSGVIRTMDVVGDSLLVGGNTLLMAGPDTLAANIMLLNLAERTFLDGGSVYPSPSAFQEYLLVDLDIQAYNHSAVYGAFGQREDGTYGTFWSSYLSTENYLPFQLDELPVINGYYESRNMIFGALALSSWGDENLPTVLIAMAGDFFGYRPVVQANGAVTALADFQKELIIAGEFTEIDGVAVNELTRASLLISDTEEVVSENLLSVNTDGQYLFLQNLPLTVDYARLELFDLAGRLVWSIDLRQGDDTQRIRPQGMPAAAYVYRLLVDDQLSVGKVVLVR